MVGPWSPAAAVVVVVAPVVAVLSVNTADASRFSEIRAFLRSGDLDGES